MSKTSLWDENFFEKFEKELEKDKSLINSREKDKDNVTYIGVAASAGYVATVAYLIDRGASIYLLSSNKQNPLHETVKFTLGYINDTAKDVNSGYKIFKLLLNFEAEQRALDPKKYKKQNLLKDQIDFIEMTPETSANGNEIIKSELQKAIAEAQSHYEKCKREKEQGIKFVPYHKEFLPEIIKIKDNLKLQNSPEVLRAGRDLGQDNKWTTKIENEEKKPLIENREVKSNSGNSIFGYFTNFFSNNNNTNGKVKTH